MGNLAWERFSLPDTGPVPAALFGDGDEVLAAAWILDGNVLEWAGADNAADAVVDWFLTVRPVPDPSAMVLDSEAGQAAALVRRGFGPRQDGPFFAHLWLDLDQMAPAHSLPEGFVLPPVKGVLEADARAAIHQAAWHPSRFTAASFRTLAGTWRYDPA